MTHFIALNNALLQGEIFLLASYLFLELLPDGG